VDSIDFYRRTFLSTKRGQLAVALASYMLGKAWDSDITGEHFDHGDGRDDVVASGTLLPDEAPAAFYDQDGHPDACKIWNAGDAAEVSSNKRNKAKVWKKRGQIAMHVIAALPFDATDEIREEIARIHAEEHRRRGAAVTWAIHRPEPGSRNYHLHMLISTRRVTKDGFGKKIRGLAAAFSRGKDHQRATIHKDMPYRQWRALIERVAAEHGWSLELDAPFAIGGVHWGHGPRGENGRNREDDAAAKAAARALLLDPKNVIATITTRQAVFTRRDLYRLLRRHDIVDEEAESIVARALADPETLRLAGSPGGIRHALFTTRTVRAQERRIVDAAARIQNRGLAAADLRMLDAAAASVEKARPLTAEQHAAFKRCLGAEGLTLIQGLAGAGKSYTMAVIREAYEQAGYRVLGVAPTNSVASDMAADGFHTASTIHLELIRQESDSDRHTPWNGKTCIIVDEAAMLDANIYERLLVRAAEAGARIVLVGDDKQLSSIERGGIYAYLRRTHGCAMLREVRRQALPWAKQASLCFAEGRILEGLQPYHDQGFITWHDGIANAANALVRQWAEDLAREPDKSRFVYAATRQSVHNLNLGLQHALWKLRVPEQVMDFESANGKLKLGTGDRLQFFGNDRKLGIMNGLIGTVDAMRPDLISVRTDGGQLVAFDPQEFDQWGLGFAGTIYRGQGRTQVQTYCLYDHTFAWGASTSYVAFTRHKESVRCYVPKDLAPDLQTLADQMSRSDPRVSSLEFMTEDELHEQMSADALAEAGTNATAPRPMDRPDEASEAAAAGQSSSQPHKLTPSVLTPESEIMVHHGDAAAAAPSRRRRPHGTTPPHADAATHCDATAMPPAPAQSEQPTVPPIIAAMPTPRSGGGGGSHKPASALPPLPYRVKLAGQERTFDLSVRQDESELLDALSAEPMPRVFEIYHQIQQSKPKDKAAAKYVEGLLGRITGRSLLRGLRPRERKIDQDFLWDGRLDLHNVPDGEPIRPWKDEVDTRPMLQPLYDIRPDVQFHLESRLKALDIEALRCLDDSLGKVAARSRHDEELLYSIIIQRLWLYDLAYEWGRDLRPDITNELKRRATPDEYRDQYIPLARKAEKAALLARDGHDGRETIEQPAKRRFFADSFFIMDQARSRLYRQRLTDQIKAKEDEYQHATNLALMDRSNPKFTEDQLIAKAHLDQLYRKLEAFEADKDSAIRTAKLIDFMPPNENVRPDKMLKRLKELLFGTGPAPQADARASLPQPPRPHRRDTGSLERD
jgi:Ti-type conjugative transfer relaxase TraA